MTSVSATIHIVDDNASFRTSTGLARVRLCVRVPPTTAGLQGLAGAN